MACNYSELKEFILNGTKNGTSELTISSAPDEDSYTQFQTMDTLATGQSFTLRISELPFMVCYRHDGFHYYHIVPLAQLKSVVLK